MSTNQFHMGITDSLILNVMGQTDCTAEDVVQFFVMQVDKLLELPPNIKRGAFAKKVPDELRIWVQRGYFPNSNVFFKISAVKQIDTDYMGMSHQPVLEQDYVTCVKVCSPESKSRQKFYSNNLAKELADYTLVGAKLGMKLKSQRILTPKGLKKLRPKKTTKRRKAS